MVNQGGAKRQLCGIRGSLAVSAAVVRSQRPVAGVSGHRAPGGRITTELQKQNTENCKTKIQKDAMKIDVVRSGKNGHSSVRQKTPFCVGRKQPIPVGIK